MATPLFEPYVVPITVVILVGALPVQRRGTGRHRRALRAGDVRLVRGARGARRRTDRCTTRRCCGALNPWHAVRFFARATGWHGFLVLGAVFLVVTGGEALYADMGHFGRRPIRLAWFAVVLPGAAAQLLRPGRAAAARPRRREQPVLPAGAGTGLLYPLVVLATAATVIASQAVISGAFSLTRQAVQLGYCPRIDDRPHLGDGDRPDLHPGGQLAADARASSRWCSASGSRPTWPRPTASRSPPRW